MRFDSIGMFWEDILDRKKRATVARTRPPVPDTGWKMPTEFPDLSRAKTLSIDLETYDPNLMTKGPGGVRGDGHIVGVSIGADNDFRRYYPIRHEGETNLDPVKVLQWVSDQFQGPQPKCGANLLYDLEWLKAEGIEIKRPFVDIQFAEALLNEHKKSYSLDACAVEHLGAHKPDTELYDWCYRAFGGKEGRSQAGNIYRAPLALVGPYAEGDADLPLRIWQKQEPLLKADGLLDLFRLECDLLPLLLAMRFNGVRVNTTKARTLHKELEQAQRDAEQGLMDFTGAPVKIWAGESVAAAFDRMSMQYPKTKAGNPSFTRPWLESQTSELAALLLRARTASKIGGTFVKSYVLDSHVNGVLYCQFHPLRSDYGGTVSGRFSSSNPNLQNIPARDPVLAPLVRGLFLPDEGCLWWQLDYSQIELRAMAHYAHGTGADAVRRTYMDNPETDFHAMVAQLTGLPRKTAKNITFAIAYGIGLKALAEMMGITIGQVEAKLETYHRNLPFIKILSKAVSNAASRRGYITTLLGRRARFPYWESCTFGEASNMYIDKSEAVSRFGNVKRARTYKAFNSLMQGTAADILKRAMLDIWNSGVCDIVGVPKLTVHDELDFSTPDTKAGKEGIMEVKNMMINCVKLRVPLLVTVKKGVDWGHLHGI